MTTTAQYASVPAIGSGTSTTADTSYTQPTNTTVGVIFTAKSSGGRIDQLDFITLGTSVAGICRLWFCEGTPGAAITSITFVGTTATVTTTASHGLSTGALITSQFAFPVDYNVKNTAITVTGLTTFTYTMGSTPTVNASTLGEYSSTPATPVYHLINREIPISAVTGSTTAVAFTAPSLSSAMNADIMPIVLPGGWSLRHTVTVTQTNALEVNARGGQF